MNLHLPSNMFAICTILGFRLVSHIFAHCDDDDECECVRERAFIQMSDDRALSFAHSHCRSCALLCVCVWMWRKETIWKRHSGADKRSVYSLVGSSQTRIDWAWTTKPILPTNSFRPPHLSANATSLCGFISYFIFFWAFFRMWISSLSICIVYFSLIFSPSRSKFSLFGLITKHLFRNERRRKHSRP